MKAYRVAEARPGERWQRTQDEARAKARSLDRNLVTKGAGMTTLVEVPTDQRGLLDFLNQFEERLESVTVTISGEREPELLTDHPPCQQLASAPADAGERRNRCPDCKSLLVATPEGADRAAWSRDLTKLDDWLDRAPDWAIERLAEQVTDKARAFRDAAGRVQ